MPAIQLSKQDARVLLVKHHFKTRSLKEVFQDFGSVQFDPLNPVGRNHDLMLQARVPNYVVDGWQRLAYEERFIYDFWDKQASLVLMQDWPVRRIFHKWHAKRWHKDVLKPYKKMVPSVLAELQERGPLTSTAFEFQPHVKAWEGSWYGPKLTKNILRALWHTGDVVTHSRKHGHHVYDLAQNIIPEALLSAPKLTDAEAIAFLVLLRHKAVGLLSPKASSEVWSLYITAAERNKIIEKLLNKADLLRIELGGQVFHAPTNILNLLDEAPLAPTMRFIAPLDQFMWDRKAIAHIFDFDYLWEVYKPEKDRKWGYYVLPVLYGDELVARFDSRLRDGDWQLIKWYWEKDEKPSQAMLDALERAVADFMAYLKAKKLSLPTAMDRATKAAWRAGEKLYANRVA